MMKNKKKIVSSLVVLLVILGCFGVFRMFTEDRVASIVLLDVNPSTELKVDSDADVIEANALNAKCE